MSLELHALSAMEAEIVAVLEQRGPLDHDLLWNGFLWNYDGADVSRALQRLRRRGLIVRADRRGWWTVPPRVTPPAETLGASDGR
jgi:DNA-binding MarR family transcriptional regulator